jgi:hypothetical protein
MEIHTLSSSYKDMDLGYCRIFCDLHQQGRPQHSCSSREEDVPCPEGVFEWILLIHGRCRVEREFRWLEDRKSVWELGSSRPTSSLETCSQGYADQTAYSWNMPALSAAKRG